MNLTIIKPDEKKTVAIAWIEVNTAVGNFVIQPQHVPMALLVLPHQPITMCLSNGKIETFTTSGGILDVKRNEATLLIDQ
ncbi:MAG: hypothetical protein AB7R69_03180 [Candidatus Babeliales bacterium]